MTNLSQWFDLTEQEPWEVGLYKVPSRFGGNYEYFSYWCGKGFHGGFDTPEDAFEHRDVGIKKGYTKWRGLSTNPEVKKKTANKRKTMYVVMKAISNSPVASFSNVNAARDYAGRVNFPVRIRRIRFRTPE